MPSANITTASPKYIFLLLSTLFSFSVSAQENSPYSRYGLGDVVPSQNMISRSMGGVAAGYSDYMSINFVNPASLGNITRTVFDIGGEVDRRTLKSNTSPEKYTATNALISYFQLGFPVSSKKMEAKGMYWGMSLGLRPITRVSYKIQENSRPAGLDSMQTLYEGSGGLNQASISTALKIKRLSIGLSGGYNFGNKDYSTKVSLLNDSIIYQRGNSEHNSSFGGGFLNAGLQYEIKMKKGRILRLGAYGNFQQSISAKKSHIVETFAFDGTGGTLTIDTVQYTPEEKGKIVYPATYGVGFTYNDANWVFGADFETTSWDNYRFYNQKDAVESNWKFRAGAQYLPMKTAIDARKYTKVIRYRAGMYYGPDHISAGKQRYEYGFTLGAGLPLTSGQRSFNEFAMLNAGIEFGGKGNKESLSVRETVLKFTVGVAMNARWFQKRKYD